MNKLIHMLQSKKERCKPASAFPGHKASTIPSAAFQKYKHPIFATATADAELADADADANDTVPLGAVNADADHAAAIEWHAAADSGAGIKTDSRRADGGEAADETADADRDEGRGSSAGKCRETKERGATRRSDDATSRRR